jgi:hypothetical protein
MFYKNIKTGFMRPVDYFQEGCNGKQNNIDYFPIIQKRKKKFRSQDNNLHFYPYIEAIPALLTAGCSNKCFFCPSYAIYKGKIYAGTPEIILPHYANMNIHFMDEDFSNNDLERVLPLLKTYNIQWLAMIPAKKFKVIFEHYGEDYLYDHGLRIVEMGLENICLFNKVKGHEVKPKKIKIMYLNMTFLPGETVETIKENAMWMMERSLPNPIYYTNGTWVGPGQFYYPSVKEKGLYLKNVPESRTMPTFIPESFLNCTIKIYDLEQVNTYNKLLYDFKMYVKDGKYNVGEFIDGDYKKTRWVATGIRAGGIV